jgi:hypothetical protein
MKDEERFEIATAASDITGGCAKHVEALRTRVDPGTNHWRWR